MRVNPCEIDKGIAGSKPVCGAVSTKSSVAQIIDPEYFGIDLAKAAELLAVAEAPVSST